MRKDLIFLLLLNLINFVSFGGLRPPNPLQSYLPPKLKFYFFDLIVNFFFFAVYFRKILTLFQNNCRKIINFK